MKILIIGTIEPYSSGDEEILCENLSMTLNELGHETDLCFLPFKLDMLTVPEQIFAYSLVCTDKADALVTVGYPACFVPHHNPCKISFLFDIFSDRCENLAFKADEVCDEERHIIIKKIKYSENKTFKVAKKLFVCSKALQEVLCKHYDVNAEVLYSSFLSSNDRECTCDSANFVKELKNSKKVHGAAEKILLINNFAQRILAEFQ